MGEAKDVLPFILVLRLGQVTAPAHLHLSHVALGAMEEKGHFWVGGGCRIRLHPAVKIGWEEDWRIRSWGKKASECFITACRP